MTLNTPHKALNLDELMQDTWLQVICLRHQPVFEQGSELALWQRCVADAERVQRVLREAGVSREARHDILLAQCALLDEVVKGRGVQDDAYVQWYRMPLQGHFLQSMDAGETLCERMQQVLAQPQADPLVLTCFHRILMLGFLGGHPAPDAPARQQLIDALSARVAPFAVMPEEGLVIRDNRRQQPRWFSQRSTRLACAVLALAALWWGLDYWLNHLIATLLPGVKG